MQIYNSLSDVLKEYDDTWAIAHFSHTSDVDYAASVAAGTDRLGYQPTLVSLANVSQQKSVEAIIRDMNDAAYTTNKSAYTDLFVERYSRTFGLFNPELKSADAVYESFDDFAAEWLQRDGRNLLSYNLPLRFDHVSDAAYWAWQQKGFDPCGTQRLIISVYQYRTNRFAEVFITNVNDAEMARIRLFITSQISLQADSLL